ncbi:MAG: lantibiotic immunity ABC transporter MutG family permease subunit [Tissierellia bacterium]|nr:lantibiotic immunity ABC transporter MutG family permease subunit [Tissierellia bacterium]
MKYFFRNLYADFYKTKKTYIPYLHLLLPLGFAILAIIYAISTSLNKESLLSAYLSIIGAAFPLIIGIVCAKIGEIEAEAGHFQAIFTMGISRKTSYLSKLSSLLIAGFLSVCLIIVPFLAFLKVKDSGLYLYSIILLIAGGVFVYILHLFVSFNYGSGASIGIGVLETLFALLGLTGLGDRIWYYLPAMWSARLASLFVFCKFNLDISYFYSEMTKWIPLFAIYISIALIFSLIWFERWEGRKNFE